MSTFNHSTRANLRRKQSPSPSDELSGGKRRRSSQHARSSPLPSTSSSSTSIGEFYGLRDENALDNVFASFPQTFSSLPRPHGSPRLHEPAWDLRSDHEIYLQIDFFCERRRIQRVRALIPGPKLDPFASELPESPAPSQQPPTRTKAEFESAMGIARQVIGEGRRLTIDLAQSYERVRAWRERWGWSPISSEAYDSPPPYSPPHTLPTQPFQTSPNATECQFITHPAVSIPRSGANPEPHNTRRPSTFGRSSL